ncbi:reverse transcriptase homolog [Calothrix parasitica NIES-267]|uniref:Reverse transcriptase homolog n=1 Tax=Calothrix parasitica NIES-267 TaxID=1973488 RepID=A0A1Z4M0S8_9CYAN|nr:reverse transcriptase homolog [Calothrix parasitica NIES-267]
MVRLAPLGNELWQRLPWKKFRRNLFRLQKRIFKAVRVGDMTKVNNLQKLVLKSTAAKLLAIRQITQLNAGKKTAGVDGIKSLNFLQRFEVFFRLKNLREWKPRELKRIPIPKKNGKVRILSVPTIFDRIWQCLIKYALEPAHEATFHAKSYGFRPGRSAHDAQKMVFMQLKRIGNQFGTSDDANKKKRIIELDIKKCFDRISHESIIKRLIATSEMKLGILRSLKAGVFPGFPEQGTSQGGVFSPILANIALNGIENIHEASIRYADDVVLFLKPNDNAQRILQKVKKFLAERGMDISEEKTKITSATTGFDFLDWHFKVQNNGKFRSTPSEDNFKSFQKKVKEIINNSNYGSEVKTQKLAPIVRGWRNYHRYCKMDGSRFSLWFIKKRAEAVFRKQKTINRHRSIELAKKAFPTVPYSENDFINVKSNRSPYDGGLVYWSQRNSKHYDGYTVSLLKKQNHTCSMCGHVLMSDENVELHHLDGNHHNWKKSNVLVMHRSCHQYIHMSKSPRAKNI